MSIIRRKSKTFTVIGNDIVNDKNLTLEALGLLVFMLSKPDNWEFNQEHLGSVFNKGRDAMRSIMKTLMSAGYVQREIQRNEKGHVRTITIVTENPVIESELLDNRLTDKPTSVDPTIGEPTPLVNTDFNKDLKSKHTSGTKSKTLKTFLAECKANNEKPLREYNALWNYAKAVNLPDDMIALAWVVFREKHSEGEGEKKKQADWRLTFLNYVKKNYLKLWFINQEGQFQYTTAGLQAQREHNE